MRCVNWNVTLFLKDRTEVCAWSFCSEKVNVISDRKCLWKIKVCLTLGTFAGDRTCTHVQTWISRPEQSTSHKSGGPVLLDCGGLILLLQGVKQDWALLLEKKGLLQLLV